MKKNILAISILISAALVSCQSNEPEQSSFNGGEISFSIPAPALQSDASSVAPRMISGDLEKNAVTFVWKVDDVINFDFLDASKGSISKTSHTVLASEISPFGGLEIKIDAPKGTKYVSVTSGPDNIPTKQYSVVNGLYNNHMRFESGEVAVVDGDNTINLLPVWSVLIISPDYKFAFSGLDETQKQHTTSYVGMNNITVTQTIGSEILSITYVGYEDNKEIPIKRSGNEGAAPAASYLVVVKPATSCDLSISLNYNPTYFTGYSDASYVGDAFTTSVDSSTPVSAISMNTTGQSVPTISKGVAYEIASLKTHPINILWNKD